MEIPTDILSITEADHIGLADNLRDCTVYQKIWNRDMLEWSASNFDDQGITFGLKGKVLDEMKHMYQFMLRTASAPGAPGDNGGDGDGNSNHSSHRHPEGNDPCPPQNGNGPANNGGNGGGRPPP